MNLCDQSRSLLSEQLDVPDLKFPEMISDHLKSCDQCSSYQRELAGLDRRLSASIPAIQPSDELHAAIMAEVRSMEAPANKVTAFPRWLIPTSIGAAAAILMLALTFNGGDEPEVAGNAGVTNPSSAAAPGLPGAFEVPIDVPGLTAAMERGMSNALSRETDALAADIGKVREFFGARFKRTVGEGS